MTCKERWKNSVSMVDGYEEKKHHQVSPIVWSRSVGSWSGVMIHTGDNISSFSVDNRTAVETKHSITKRLSVDQHPMAHFGFCKNSPAVTGSNGLLLCMFAICGFVMIAWQMGFTPIMKNSVKGGLYPVCGEKYPSHRFKCLNSLLETHGFLEIFQVLSVLLSNR